ncbi:unnamed protein product, partial [Effrenium voratum]
GSTAAPKNPPPKARQNHPKSPKRGRGKKGETGPEFTDGFSKLQHGQPPILDTMVVVPGVTLEQMGKHKSGPESDSRFMSRKEYVQLAEAEVPESGFRPRGSIEEPQASREPNVSDGKAPPEAATALPQIPAGRQAAPAYPGPPDEKQPGAAQKAPPAPAALARRKYEALGFVRDPRYHAPNLGGGLGLGSA